MNHIDIIKQAFSTTLRYRALWILGFLWALVGGSAGSGRYTGSPGRGGSGWRADKNPFPGFHLDWAQILPWIILGCAFLLALGIVLTIIRYILQAGIYRSLQRLQAHGEAPTVRGAWREGNHRRTWRLFVQDVVVAIPTVLFLMLLGALAASPLLLLFVNNDWVKGVGIVTAIALLIGWVFVLIAVAMAINILKQFWWRAAVLDDIPTFEALRRGWSLVRSNLQDVLIMWLLMLGIGILFSILMIPLVLLLGAITAALAGLPGYLIFQTTSSWVPTLLWALPVAFLTLVVPLTFIQGLFLIFQAEVWNQVYRQISPLAEAEAGALVAD